MDRVLSADAVFQQLSRLDGGIKLTALRKDVLNIIIQAEKPISAYDILSQLREMRDSAEPPTVYRVVEYFLEKHIIHRINAENKYVLCTQLGHTGLDRYSLILICKKCLSANEVSARPCIDLVKNLAQKQAFFIDVSPIEISGICQRCISV